VRAFADAYSDAVKRTFTLSCFVVNVEAGGGSIALTANRPAKMTVDEAYKILGIQKGTPREKMAEQFQRQFDANDPEKGGSFYLQAKIYNAKAELVKAGEL